MGLPSNIYMGIYMFYSAQVTSNRIRGEGVEYTVLYIYSVTRSSLRHLIPSIINHMESWNFRCLNQRHPSSYIPQQ